MPDLSNIYIVVLNHVMTIALLVLFIAGVTRNVWKWLDGENSDMPTPVGVGPASTRLLALLMIVTGFIHPLGLVYGTGVIVLSVVVAIVWFVMSLIDFIRYGIFTMSESPAYLFTQKKQNDESKMQRLADKMNRERK